MSSSLFSIDHEKQFLSAAIRNPSILADARLAAKDFSAVNRPVFEILRQCAATEGTGYSKFILAQRLTSIGAKIGGVLDPGTYIDSLELLNVSDQAAVGVAEQIRRTTVRRKLHEVGRAIEGATAQDKGLPANELIANATAAFNQEVNLLEGSAIHEPIDFYDTIEDFLNGGNPFAHRSITSPYPIFNDLYGYWDAGSLHVIVSRMKVGKSTFWLSTIEQLARADKDDELRVLVLDTELTTAENHSRNLSAASGVSEFDIRQGIYKRNKVSRDKVEHAARTLRCLKKRMHHCFVGGMELDEMLSVARRWAHRTLTEGKRGLIVLDYFKLNSGADFASKSGLFLTIGAKADAFKNLSKELSVPCLCFAQTNRENEDSKAGGRMQNSSVIAGSDYIAQFASNVYLLQDLTPEEQMELGQIAPGDATHSLREIACRQRGPNQLKQHRRVLMKDARGKDRWHRNYLLFSFDSFRVKEIGTLKDIVERGALVVNVQEDTTPKGPLL